MHILVISTLDATNLTIANVVNEFLNRGHDVGVYGTLLDYKSVRMFTQLGLVVHPVSELNPNIISSYDVAFTGTDMKGILRFSDIFIFNYNFLFTYRSPTEGSDFMFTICDPTAVHYLEDCSIMAVGNPKNDRPNVRTTKRQILYVDAGHMPFGHTAKLRLAHLLLKICSVFPDYNLVIKPRWLLTDQNFTHKNDDHIYTILEQCAGIDGLPTNLVLLQEHYDLQDLIDESTSVISTSLSTYLDVALRGKGVVIVDGLGSEDKYEIRTNTSMKEQLDSVRSSGCLVDYHDVINYLPLGIKCDEDHLKNILPCRTGASKHIVDAMEWIFETYLKKGEFPQIGIYSINNYKEQMSSDISIDFNYLKRKRIKNSIIAQTRTFDWIDVALDYSAVYNTLNTLYKDIELTPEAYYSLQQTCETMRECVVVDNADKLMSDALNQAELIRALYSLTKYDKLIEIPEEQILCASPWNYYMGMIYYKRKDTFLALQHFVAFLNEANQRPYAKYPCEDWWGIRDAYSRIIKLYKKENISDSQMANLFVALYKKNNYKYLEENVLNKFLSNIPTISFSLLDDKQYQLCAECLSIYVKSGGKNQNEVIDLKRKIAKIKKSKSYRIAKSMFWLPNKIFRGIKCIKENGVKYTLSNIKGKIRRLITKCPTFTIFNEFKKNIYPAFRIYENLIKEFGANSHFYLSAGGTGDVYISCFYYKKYISLHHQSDTAIYLLPNEGCYQVTALFNIDGAKKIEKADWIFLLKLYRFDGNISTKLEMMYYHIFLVYPGYLTWLEGYKNWNLFNLMHQVHFGEIDRNDVDLPVFDEKQAEKVFCELGLVEGKTVILCPYAKWPPLITNYFWTKLADKLHKKGFMVCTNSIGEKEPPISGTIPVSYSYNIAVPFVKKAGYLVGLRSGLLDIIESAQCKKVALYPSDCKKRGITGDGGGEGAMDSFSLNAMFGKNDWLELITAPDNFQEVIVKILQYFDET